METKNSVLIVDDEEMNLRMLTGILSETYDIRTANSGQAAVEAAFADPPDLILLDVLMPEMDGYEVLAHLKRNEKTLKIPVIFITGLDSKEDEEKGLAMDAADYISKPFSVGIVRLRVKNQIQIVNQIRTIENLSLIDQLTGIPNRRNLDNRFVMEWSRAFRERLPLSLMMIDIDKFKLFNDKYGHLTGDEVLKTVAASFKRALKRKSDFAARYGGEEFSVLLPNTDVDGALIIAEDVRKVVEQLVIPLSDGGTTTVTISVGVHSLIPSAEDTIPDAIAKADHALYNAKETGRNRVCLYTDEMGIPESAKPEKENVAAESEAPSAAPPRSEVKYSVPDVLAVIGKIDVINLKAGLSHFQGMDAMYADSADFFRKKILKNCGDMDGFLKAGKIKDFSISVHSVKSMLSTVGAVSLSETAAELETASKNGDAEYCLANYPEFHQKLLNLHKLLSEVFEDGGETKPKATGNADMLNDIYGKIVKAAETFEADAALEAVTNALEYDFNEEINELLSSALSSLTDFDFDAVELLCKRFNEVIEKNGKTGRKKLLHVDDVSYSLISLKDRLKKHYEVYSAQSAEKMFEILENITPDMILLDINMPDIDGYEVIKQLKAESRYAKIPVIFLTSTRDDVSVAKCMNLGAADIVFKPVSDAELTGRIEYHFNSSGN